MATIKILKRDKILGNEEFLILLNDYINDSYYGRRLKKNGQRISSGTIENYSFLKRTLHIFIESTNFKIKLYLVDRLNQREKETASRYWKKFYNSFTHFLYYNQGHYDNYVGSIIKNLKSFLNYILNDRNINIGTFHKHFYAPVEEIPIIALTQEQLNYIIYNDDFSAIAKQNGLEKVKDIFIFGCSVALRASDLLNLTRKNLIITNNNYYLIVKSQKTNTSTKIKLPNYAIKIINKYINEQKTLLPKISLGWFDLQLKKLGTFLPDNFILVKTREKKGKPIIIYKDQKKKIHFHLSDHLTSHTMRRTAITNMLNLGMPEHVVRKISGHAANSKEFFRYVQLSQSFIDDETDRFFEKINTFNYS